MSSMMLIHIVAAGFSPVPMMGTTRTPIQIQMNLLGDLMGDMFNQQASEWARTVALSQQLMGSCSNLFLTA